MALTDSFFIGSETDRVFMLPMVADRIIAVGIGHKRIMVRIIRTAQQRQAQRTVRLHIGRKNIAADYCQGVVVYRLMP